MKHIVKELIKLTKDFSGLYFIEETIGSVIVKSDTLTLSASDYLIKFNDLFSKYIKLFFASKGLNIKKPQEFQKDLCEIDLWEIILEIYKEKNENKESSMQEISMVMIDGYPQKTAYIYSINIVVSKLFNKFFAIYNHDSKVILLPEKIYIFKEIKEEAVKLLKEDLEDILEKMNK